MTRPSSATVPFLSRLFFSVLLGALSLVCLLFCLAVGLIVLDLHKYAQSHREWNKSFYVQEGRDFVNQHPRMAKHAFPAEKEKDVFRIFFVGDSSVIGWPYVKRQTVLFPGLNLNSKQAGISCWLELRLRRAGIKAEVINAGMEWGAVDDEVKLVEEILEIGQPDAILFMSGHSEGAKFFENAYCPPEQNLEQAIDKISRGYKAGLDKIIALTQKKQTPLILLTQAINLRDWAPEDFDAAVDRRKIEELLNAGKAEDARKILTDENEKSPMRLRLFGRTYLAQKNFAKAQEYFIQAYGLSRKFTTSRKQWNDVISAYHNKDFAGLTQVLNFAAAFYQNSPDGLPGMDLFLDSCHFNLNGQRLAADIIAGFLMPRFFNKHESLKDFKLMPLSQEERARIKRVFRIAKFNIVRYRFLRFVLSLRVKHMSLAEENNLSRLYENYTNRISEYTKSLETDNLN